MPSDTPGSSRNAENAALHELDEAAAAFVAADETRERAMQRLEAAIVAADRMRMNHRRIERTVIIERSGLPRATVYSILREAGQ